MSISQPPESSPVTPHPPCTVIVHHGALGDFLCAWPALRALALHHDTHSGSSPLYCHGNGYMLRWLAPLGYRPCPPPLARALDALYGGASLPCNLTRDKVFWFCLDGLPEAVASNVTVLPCMAGGRHVSLNLLDTLEGLGIPTSARFSDDWRACFGTWEGTGSKTVALFPGAGHRLKQWPLARFAQVAARLVQDGWQPVWVLGPVERDRGLSPPDGIPVLQPEDMDALTTLLLSARIVIGNDSGPLHLAAMHGVPVLALFGPVDPVHWAPHGAVVIRPEIACAPCSTTTRGLECSLAEAGETAGCLMTIHAERVLDAARRMLARPKRDMD